MMFSSTEQVADRVIQALMEDKRTKDALIDVVNSQGVVTLTGQVSSEKVRQSAEEIALQQEGVITVVNELKVA